jgi:hypothetical protein
MTTPKSSLSVVTEEHSEPKTVSSEEFIAGFMKFATTLVDFEKNHQAAPPPARPFRVTSLASLRVKASVNPLPGSDVAERETSTESAQVMPFRRATESNSGNT